MKGGRGRVGTAGGGKKKQAAADSSTSTANFIRKQASKEENIENDLEFLNQFVEESHVEVDADLDAQLHNLDHMLTTSIPFGGEAKASNRRRSMTMSLSQIDEMTFVNLYQSSADTFYRWMLLLSRGISGQIKLLSYDLQSLVRYGGFLTMHLDGTLMTMDKASMVFFCGLLAFYTLVFVGVTSLTSKGHEMDTKALEEMTNTLNKVVPFVLGLYITLALNRWWTIRKEGLSEVLNAACNVVMVVSCILPSERHRSVRVLVMKWSFASVFLLVKAVREQKSLNDMLFKGLLNEEEVGILNDVPDLYGRPSVVWGWVLRIVNESFSEASGPMPYSVQVSQVCTIVLQASNGLNCIDNHLTSQLPFVYVHLIALLVDLNSFFLVLKSGVVSAVAANEGNSQRLCTETVSSLLVPMLYRGLLSVSYAVYDPFGDDVLDFPIGSFMEWNAQCCNAIFKAQERFPGVPHIQHDNSPFTRKSMRMDSYGSHGSHGSHDEHLEGLLALGKTKEERLHEIKEKFRRILITNNHNGKLEQAVRQMHEQAKAEEAIRDLHHHANLGKINAGVKAASIAAAPLADEIKSFCVKFRNELVKLRQNVLMLRDAIEQDGFKQHEEFEAVTDNLFTYSAMGV